MPNWCENSVEITHKDPAMLERVRKGFNEGSLLQEFIPCPQELIDTVAGSFGTGPEQEALLLKEASNLAKYGHKNWYDWCVANWGTKWDVGANGQPAQDLGTEIGQGLILNFESAWSPPIEAYAKLEELGFGIKAFYYEPGMAFVGKWEDGNDDYIEYGGETSDTVRDVIGDELDDMFAISEQMAEWEAEEEEAEEE
jgi:hypothetical protein